MSSHQEYSLTGMGSKLSLRAFMHDRWDYAFLEDIAWARCGYAPYNGFTLRSIIKPITHSVNGLSFSSAYKSKLRLVTVIGFSWLHCFFSVPVLFLIWLFLPGTLQCMKHDSKLLFCLSDVNSVMNKTKGLKWSQSHVSLAFRWGSSIVWIYQQTF